jgi:aminomethyltransferase
LTADELKRTPLHSAHVKAGARMVPFVGWHLPVQYMGIVDEHMAVRERAGLFDVSHMGEFSVRGVQAEEFLQRVTCNNVAKLKVDRAQYTGLMLPNGAFVDDLLIYRLDGDDFLLVVNAANTEKDLAWLREHAVGFEVELSDVSDDFCQIALQGPRALESLKPLCATALDDLRYYGFARTEVDGVSCIVSRTGYTGEDGFEIYAPSESAEDLWYALLGSGAPHGVVPVGLGARDTLRLEAKMALYGNDIDDTTTALEADLGWIVKLKKGEFIGRDVLAQQKTDGVSRKLVGFEMRSRAIARHGYPALKNGETVGRVTSGSFAPYLQKNIGLAYLPQGMWEPGTTFEVGIRRRSEPAEVVSTPFYKRQS